MTARKRSEVQPPQLDRRIALTPEEAAAALGVSRSYFDDHVLPELHTIRRGSLLRIPVAELRRWADREAS